MRSYTLHYIVHNQTFGGALIISDAQMHFVAPCISRVNKIGIKYFITLAFVLFDIAMPDWRNPINTTTYKIGLHFVLLIMVLNQAHNLP